MIFCDLNRKAYFLYYLYLIAVFLLILFKIKAIHLKPIALNKQSYYYFIFSFLFSEDSNFCGLLSAEILVYTFWIGDLWWLIIFEDFLCFSFVVTYKYSFAKLNNIKNIYIRSNHLLVLSILIWSFLSIILISCSNIKSNTFRDSIVILFSSIFSIILTIWCFININFIKFYKLKK